MSDDILVITDRSGYPFGNREDNLAQLKKMGYELDENNEKLNMQKLSNIAFAIYKSDTHTLIVAHTFYANPKIKGQRGERCYFIFNVDGSGATADILTALKQFTEKANDEIKKYGMEIKEDEKTLYPFRDITKVINYDKTPPIREDLLNAACECLNRKQSMQLKAHSIEKVIPFLTKLYSKCKYLTVIIYTDERGGVLEEPNVNIFIDKHIPDIKPLNFGETHKSNVLPLKPHTNVNNYIDKIEPSNSEPVIGSIVDNSKNISRKESLKTLIKPVTIEGKTVNSGKETNGIIGSFLALTTIALLLINFGGWVLWIPFLFVLLVFIGSCLGCVSYCKQCNEIFDFEVNTCPLCSSVLTKNPIDDVKEKLKKGGKLKQTTTHKLNVLPPVSIPAPTVTTSFSDMENIIKVLEEIKYDVRQKDRMGAKKKIESLLNMAGS